ncbi:MAG: methionine gamma-lyase family protein [Christensenellaceae bacterium]
MIDEKLIDKCETELADEFKILEKTALFNQEKVLNAFKKNKIALRHFVGSSGYGYGDDGRDTLNRLFADVFKAETAICSPNIVSGTHALSLCLYGVLRPNDTALSISGGVYDTLNDVIKGENNGSLKDFGINFECVDLKGGDFDYTAIKQKLTELKPKMVYIQRSRGYEWRNAISVSQIEKVVGFLRENGFDGCIMLDNCYGEFTEKQEATEIGVNLAAGSLIKNAGGGIAPTGGYVVGDKNYVDMVANRLTAPSIGGEVGSYMFGYQYFYQGLFLAPHTVLQALKGVMLFSKVLSELGFKVSPASHKIPRDIITMIEFGDREKLISFIQSIQENSPVDSNVRVLPWEMPGYNDPVIMAAGCFVQGASIELSADAPVKPPFIAYLQGGITYEHCKIALKNLKL